MSCMYSRIQHKLFISIFIAVIFCSCTKEKEAPVIITPPPVPAPVPPAAVVEEPQALKPTAGLAMLEKLSNKASTRAHAESIWQNAVAGINFSKHDALRTHEMATALIKYESGSKLELKEKTLIIFDKDPGVTENLADRVLLKSGELVGTTKRELWVFTNAGLVQLKASAKNQQPTKATVSVNEKKMRVNVINGSADLILRNENKNFQKISLAEKSDFEFKANADFEIDEIAKASGRIKNATLAELAVDSPPENAVSSEEQYVVKGKLSGLGAKLLINGESVEISDALTFSKTITLISGTNLVVFQLIRSDASVKFYRKNIRYTPK